MTRPIATLILLFCGSGIGSCRRHGARLDRRLGADRGRRSGAGHAGRGQCLRRRRACRSPRKDREKRVRQRRRRHGRGLHRPESLCRGRRPPPRGRGRGQGPRGGRHASHVARSAHRRRCLVRRRHDRNRRRDRRRSPRLRRTDRRQRQSSAATWSSPARTFVSGRMHASGDGSFTGAATTSSWIPRRKCCRRNHEVPQGTRMAPQGRARRDDRRRNHGFARDAAARRRARARHAALQPRSSGVDPAQALAGSRPRLRDADRRAVHDRDPRRHAGRDPARACCSRSPTSRS